MAQYPRGVRLTGLGMHVPENVVTNQDLERLMDTSDEWIRQRSGIKERRFVDDHTHPSDLAVEASKRALEQASCRADEIDLIIIATLSPEHFFPGTSVFVQQKLGLSTTPAMDVRCQCSGFIYGLSVARGLIASGQYERILLCGTEVHSRGLDLTTRGRDVAVLFGDGAGAAVLTASDNPEQGLIDTVLHAQGEFAEKLWVEKPGMKSRPFINQNDLDEGAIWPQMDGRFVFKHAVRRLPEVVHELLSRHQLKTDDIDHFVFHQANLRINEAVMQQLNQPVEKAYNNISRYGNCSAASIPLAMSECVNASRFKSGDLICLASFGSGFTWASALIRW